MIRRITSILILVSFIGSTIVPSSAQIPNGGAHRDAPLQPFFPPMIKGLTVYPNNPLKFDFLVSKGQTHLPMSELKKESTRLIKYFLASLTVPEEDLWVNLSPYEKNRIIPDGFGKTGMGMDLLAQDYFLKQLCNATR